VQVGPKRIFASSVVTTQEMDILGMYVVTLLNKARHVNIKNELEYVMDFHIILMSNG